MSEIFGSETAAKQSKNKADHKRRPAGVIDSRKKKENEKKSAEPARTARLGVDDQILVAIENLAFFPYVDQSTTASDFYGWISILRDPDCTNGKEDVERSYRNYLRKIKEVFNKEYKLELNIAYQDKQSANVFPRLIATYLQEHAAFYAQEAVNNYCQEPVMHPSPEKAPPPEYALARLVWVRFAINLGLALEASYKKFYHGTTKKIKIVPLELVCMENVLLLVAIDLAEKKIKQYALANLDFEIDFKKSLKSSGRQIKITNEVEKIKTEYSYESYSRSAEAQFGYPLDLYKIEIPPRFLDVFKRKFQSDFKDVNINLAEDIVSLSFKTHDRRLVFALLAFLGPEAKIVEPAFIALHFKNRLKRTISSY